MATFVLIHGAWHGAWCWNYVTPILEKEGHKVITPNLPIDTSATLVDYAKIVSDQIKDESGVVLVGHSMAGLIIPLIADEVLVSKLIYLCPVLRRAGCSLAQDHEEEMNPGLTIPGFENTLMKQDGGFSSLKREAIPYFYEDCSSEIQDWAYGNLRKQYSYWNEVNPQEEWPDISVASIVCTEDKAIDPLWLEKVSQDWLNVTPKLLSSGHSPFLSRPKELAEILMEI